MGERIHSKSPLHLANKVNLRRRFSYKSDYFVAMGLSHDEASKLHHKYFTQYGLALRGLVRHHQVDPLDFDKKCDGSLPLETLIRPDPMLRRMLQDIDRDVARVWALTNAYRTVRSTVLLKHVIWLSLVANTAQHAKRVLSILQIDDLIDGIVFCDYAELNFCCKPEADYFKQVRVTGWHNRVQPNDRILGTRKS